MANEIYTQARDGLSALVSQQAAESVLERSVAAAGLDADDVDVATMSRLLRGRVRRALERTLPKPAVRRHLADLDRRLAAQASAAPTAVEETPAVGATRATEPTVATRSTPPASPPPALLDRIGDLEAVRQWIWAPDARPATGRGVGPDPERARRSIAPMVTVLRHFGAVRSMHVHHGRGHVLLGRAPGATIAVAGDMDLNLGAIYATFRALEEEP